MEEGIKLQNKREILLSKCPELFEIGKRIASDLEQLVRVRAVLFPIVDNKDVQESFNGTFRGNAFVVIRGSLMRDATLIVSRLFHPPRRSNGRMELGQSDHSLVLASELFGNDETMKTRLRDRFRWAASGSRSIIEGGKFRDETLAASLRNRIKDGKADQQETRLTIATARKAINEFAASKAYGQIKTFRTENVAHNLIESNDRKKFNILKSDPNPSFDQLDRAISEVLKIGEESCSAFFGRHLSLGSLAEIWSDYSSLFWCRASGVALPTSGLEDER